MKMRENITLSLAIFDSLKKGVAIFQGERIYAQNTAFKNLFRLNKSNHQNFLALLKDQHALLISYPEKDIISSIKTPAKKILERQEFENEVWQVTDNLHGECWYGNFSGELIQIGDQSYYVIYVDDISESYLAKAKLKTETKFFYDVINALPVMLTIYNPELDEIYLNKAIEDIIGWTNEDTKNKSIMNLAYPDPEYRKKIAAYMRSAKEGFADIIMRTKDGRDIITSWANVKLSDGRQIGIGLDINKQREIEKQVKESEEKFRNLADNISQLAWIADENGDIFWYNKRWFDYTGKSLKESRGRAYKKLIHPRYQKQVESFYQNCIQTGKIWEDSFPIRGKNDEYRWFLSRALPIKNENGKIKSWFGTNTDITELKNLQDRLIEANEKAENAVLMQKTFIQNISHEVRTPMNSILGFTELLEKSISNPEDKEYLESISYNGRQLLTLINDIIDFSRLDSKDLKLSYESVSLEKLFQELENQFEALVLHFKKTNISFKLNIKPEDRDISIYADQHRLSQVMNNLISNAVKYTNEGYIEVGYKVLESPDRIMFFVKDTGIGIEKKYAQLIFKRFHQTDRKQLHGTGLGLAICKHLVNLFGGEIWFESTEGKGSSFFFTYPFEEIPQDKNDKATLQEAETVQPDLTGKTILVAEDDEYSYSLLEAMISPTNAGLVHAMDGKQAVEFFKNHKPDLVFLDIRLPEMDGYEVLETIKKTNHKTPVIAQTAYAMPEDKAKSHTSGFDFHTTKPISMKKLYMILNAYLKNKNITEDQ